MIKNPPATARDMGLIPGMERFLGIGNGNPLQYSCLENSMDRGTWRATVHGVAESWTQLSTHTLRVDIVRCVAFWVLFYFEDKFPGC